MIHFFLNDPLLAKNIFSTSNGRTDTPSYRDARTHLKTPLHSSTTHLPIRFPSHRFLDFSLVEFDFVAEFFDHFLESLHVLLVLFGLEFEFLGAAFVTDGVVHRFRMTLRFRVQVVLQIANLEEGS